tara:strand:+ start:125 stop:487 length:363 start_codon:yes stop_codon:yes gene_type:complete
MINPRCLITLGRTKRKAYTKGRSPDNFEFQPEEEYICIAISRSMFEVQINKIEREPYSRSYRYHSLDSHKVARMLDLPVIQMSRSMTRFELEKEHICAIIDMRLSQGLEFGTVIYDTGAA